MIQRPGDDHAVWHFWTGEDRTFSCWYINLQTAFVRTTIGIDTMDLELDLVVLPTGDYVVKDLDVLPERVAEGRLTQTVVDHVLAARRPTERRARRGTLVVGHRLGRVDARSRPTPCPTAAA